jgi:hypothetical protein
MIKTETASPDTIGKDNFNELAPGVFQNEAGPVILHDGDQALKIVMDAPPSTKD